MFRPWHCLASGLTSDLILACPSTMDVLVVAISCIACMYCGSGLDHFARMRVHACCEVVFRTCVVHSTMMLVKTIV